MPPIAVPAIWSHVGEVRADRAGKQKLVWDWAVCAVTLREAPQNRLLGVQISPPPPWDVVKTINNANDMLNKL